VVLEEQQAQHVSAIRGDMVVAEWGRQIRNYVFQPYKMVKDTRTGVETSDVQGVMDGALDPFMTAYLRRKGAEATQEMLGALEARAL
jgi:peptide chain release factor 2